MITLLTGQSGFVGQFVRQAIACECLERNGMLVDLRDAPAVAATVAAIRPDRVIHLAAQAFVPASFADPLKTFETNFIGTYNLLSGLKSAGFKGRMLFVSSGDTYGLVPPECLPISENQPQHPRSPYSVSKVAAEALCYQWSQTEGFEIVLARPFNHIGPKQSPQFVVADFAQQIAEIKRGRRPPVLTVGDIDVTRDFVDVRDVVCAYTLLLECGANGEAYNVCSGIEVSVREVIAALMRSAGVTAHIEQDAARLRKSEQRRVVGSNAKLFAATGWRPEFNLDRSIGDIIDHLLLKGEST